jgi:hypothetical protein
MAHVLLFSTLTVSMAHAFNCSIPPIYVDMHKRAVHGTSAFEYGTFIGVGTAAQNQSLFPSIRFNETALTDIGYCNGNGTGFGCKDNTTGGFFEKSQSTR